MDDQKNRLQKLRRDILRLGKSDFNSRKKGILSKNDDQRRADELEKIIKIIGWPTIPLVGKKASFYAWLIVQHSDHNISFQKKCLRLMQKSVISNEVELWQIAMLTDRVLVAQKKPQRFGTQFYWTKSGFFKPRPIEDKKKVESLRARFGLPPFHKELEDAKNNPPPKPKFST